LADLKREELAEVIVLCSGLWLDATADKFAAVPGGALKFTATALNRERLAVEVDSVEIGGIAQAASKDKFGKVLPGNEPQIFAFTATVPANQPLSAPYWLSAPKQGDTYSVSNQLDVGQPENAPLFRAHFRLRIESQDVEVTRPVLYRYIERAQGELTRSLVVQPPVALRWSEDALVFPNGAAKTVELQIKSNTANATGRVRIQTPDGWQASDGSGNFKLTTAGAECTLPFQITPPARDGAGGLNASAQVGDQTATAWVQTINYPHIPPQVLFPQASAKLVRADVHVLAKTIGYVMGAGDEVPQALRQLGSEVMLLGPEDLAQGSLSGFDAIVTGVRAYNTRADLRANQQRLLDYAKNGGTLVVQYNTPEGGGAFGGTDSGVLDHIGPYAITTGRDRVTVEEAPVVMLDPKSPLLHRPNEITAVDFENWIQERGLNFPSQWDGRYRPLFETHDPGEKPLAGGTLYVRYGKGAYVFTSFSWFRELPAGVPGAFRIFANLLSAGKTL